MTLLEWFQANVDFNLDPKITAVLIGIIFMIAHDFYHMLFSAVLSWFKKG